jgi:hypothetical protein
VVLLRCCTVSTPSPWAIYIRQGKSWRLSYERIGYKTENIEGGTLAAYTVFGLRVSGATQPPSITEQNPWYGPTDANCCPSGYVYRTVAWDGSRFVATTSPVVRSE